MKDEFNEDRNGITKWTSDLLKGLFITAVGLGLMAANSLRNFSKPQEPK